MIPKKSNAVEELKNIFAESVGEEESLAYAPDVPSELEKESE